MMKEQFIQLVKPIISRSPRLAMTYRYARDTWNCIRSGTPGREQFGGGLIRPIRGNGRNQVGKEGTLVLLTGRVTVSMRSTKRLPPSLWAP